MLAGEIDTLARQRGGSTHQLVGPRHALPVDADLLRALAPDVARRDVYVCGPPGFMRQVLTAAADAGVPPSHCHYETFDP